MGLLTSISLTRLSLDHYTRTALPKKSALNLINCRFMF